MTQAETTSLPRIPSRCAACGLFHADHEVRCPLTGRPLEGTSELPPSLALAASQATGRRRALLGRVLQGKYRPTAVIAEGGMGTVYEAEHLPSGRLVAIKALDPAYAGDPDVVRRFRREARSVRSIGHPNICAIHEVGRLDDGGPYLVMERLRGETLADRIEREGALPLADALGVARQVLGALGAAHDKGVVHRDVKPDNIFLVAEGRGPSPAIKLLDFGLSKAEGDDGRLSYDGAIVGTPLYMAPEQALGEAVDLRADLWAVGVVLYESLTGRCPFIAFNYGALLRLVASEEPRLVRALRPSLPEAVERLVCKALAKRPADRFQSAREFRSAIAARSADAWGGRPEGGPPVEGGGARRSPGAETNAPGLAERGLQGARGGARGK
jgi:serine/threonine-protein kinase